MLKHWSTALILFGILNTLLLTGCHPKMVHSRSIADLNAKAQELLAKGDPAGAVARLESARDLNPEEPTTLYNLAISYQAKGDLERSMETFESLIAIKNLPKNLKRGAILQSLAVVCESKADELMIAVDQAVDAQKVKEATELRQQSLAFYEKANDAYRQAIETQDLKPQAVQQLTAQQTMIHQRIQELKDKELKQKK